ncbi:MAG: aspartate/glutamate racemase family protein [Rhodanobacter sp.]
MQTIGLIGGMSWESTATYYRLINESVRQRLGGLHSAKVILYSVDFEQVERMQVEGDWEGSGVLLGHVARALESGGADFLLLCTNTMHKVAPAIQAAVNIPFLHIADATAEAIKDAGLSRVGLLGTRFTMEQDFYTGRLRDQHGLEVLVPGLPDREIIHRVIYEELCLGRLIDRSRDEYRRIVANLVSQGAEAIILGCTEISLLVQQGDASVPLFDTTSLHASKAVDWALAPK